MQRGAVEACPAHNRKVGGSKPPVAKRNKVYLIKLSKIYYTIKIIEENNEL